ncbi:UdgX family uracil-DNA binding protein [Xanthomonas hyacinthi]|uniref:Type-4 uracil-DNA glycosylase n=1 Tax=Xanthomonas hyacinthi TaxID=56455 RepID=A0A2S7EUC6_9XANT|nr:UdgX family uracil-DNA binding protein [Xanthomonas hyacinthi]PPU96764.1 uracil-DNA glycosylase [Xanthomonas hyacinthi]QGY76288.1 UdgX family uracil-DNA binding protein [Xanthomonas hyacinthi]
MFRAEVVPGWGLEAWRAAARAAWCAQVAPASLLWEGDAQGGLLIGTEVAALPATVAAPRVSAEFLALAGAVLCHRDSQRHALLYRLLWRIASGERALLQRVTDADVHRAQQWAQAVRRDSHKMKAFVRFREVPGEDEAFVAWFEPEHRIVDRIAPFFARRFAGMRWAILTPYRSVRWDGAALQFGAGAQRADAPADDAQDALWRIYYANTFNPARLNPGMMRQEMPQKYWKNLPETQLLPGLIRDAGQRVRAMAERAPAPVRRRIPAPLPVAVDADGSLDALRAAARECRRCALWQPATQAVFGEGPHDAAVMVVGEQPGDEEDLSGRPFVGPAGRLFDRALVELGIARAGLYVTNAVKHFRFEQRGKARLHRTPDRAQVEACRFWLAGELARVRPRIVLCLGATAARAVLGNGFALMAQRGQWQTLADGTRALASVHPSWVLRQRGGEAGEAAYRGFVDDLRALAQAGETPRVADAQQDR